jgi:hypothetical protein
VRVDTADYSVNPQVIGRLFDVAPEDPSPKHSEGISRSLAVGDVRLICLGGLVFGAVMASF